MIDIAFDNFSSCAECKLHDSSKNPGLPTRIHSYSGNTDTSVALLVVGEASGFLEDKTGKSWVGYNGKVLDLLLEGIGIVGLCDIYLSNACRCKPALQSKVTNGEVNKCRSNLIADVEKLNERYRSTVLLACGAPAARSCSGIGTLKKAFQKQGQPSEVIPGVDSVFFTYHPVNLHPDRKPALLPALEAHLHLVKGYLDGTWKPNLIQIEVEEAVRPPKTFPKLVAIDIETYGIIKGVNQTVFNPIKSQVIDGVPFDKQIITVALAWREGEKIRTSIYKFQNRRHRNVLYEWFRSLVREESTLIGQNIKFDLSYLSKADCTLGYYIDPNKLFIDDVLLWGFLEYEQRPERGLKEVCSLFGVADYNALSVTGKLGNAKNDNSTDLHYYNCLDSAVCIELQDRMMGRIQQRFGVGSSKLGETCAYMRNAVTWDCIALEQSGIALGIEALYEHHNRREARATELYEEALGSGYIFKGKGSEKSKRDLVTLCLESAGLEGDSRVDRTVAKNEISYGKANRNLALGSLATSPLRDWLERFEEFSSANHDLNSFTIPLLTKVRRGIVHRDRGIGIAYPTWYPIPGYHSRGGNDEEKPGGQIQGRFSAKQPGATTFPPFIQECFVSRFAGGKVIGWDESQIELRMAGLLSGDSALMKNYEEDGDLHTVTALAIFDCKEDEPDFRKTFRQWAKTVNFLVLYKGGASAFQTTVMKDSGIELDYHFCKATIERWYDSHKEFADWQAKLITTAVMNGYVELPTGWSRTFTKGKVGPYLNEICNMPIQTLAAQLTQSAQFEIYKRMRADKAKSRIIMNVYDALYFDVYPGEEEYLTDLADLFLVHPPLIGVLEEKLGRTIPLRVDKKVYYDSLDAIRSPQEDRNLQPI